MFYLQSKTPTDTAWTTIAVAEETFGGRLYLHNLRRFHADKTYGSGTSLRVTDDYQLFIESVPPLGRPASALLSAVTLGLLAMFLVVFLSAVR